MLLLCAASVGAASRRPGEFDWAKAEGRPGGPDQFLQRHAVRLAWPTAPERLSRLESARPAWQKLKNQPASSLAANDGRPWQTVGPESLTDNDDWKLWEPRNSSGRVTALAIGNRCDQAECRLYVGTAGGGLWRSDQALHLEDPAWARLSEGLDNNNIGAVALDPNDATARTLYVGTGEANFNYTSAAGVGLFRSNDGGERFLRMPTMYQGQDFTLTRGIGQVAIEPGNPDTLYVATTTAMLGMTAVRGGQSTSTGQQQPAVGLYRTLDGGASWELLFEAPINTRSSAGTPEGIYEKLSGVKDVQVDPLDPRTIYISVADDGLYRSSPALDGDDGFRPVFKVATRLEVRGDSYAAFDLVVSNGTTRVYVYNGNGFDYDYQALYRLDDANVPATQLFADEANQPAWQNLTTPVLAPADYVDFSICNGQCVYDLVVASPTGRPDEVYLGGQLSRELGDPAMRSTNAGDAFTSLAIDLQNPPGTPHVDVRAIVFSPDDPDVAFIGSDGGVVRTNGRWGDGRRHCTDTVGYAPGSFEDRVCQEAYARLPEAFVFMNRGLQTMQLYNVAADPAGPLGRQMAGTQDNSTQWNGGSPERVDWTKLFNIGDGTSANGFHPTDPNILFASYQSNWFFTHFAGGQGGTGSWVITSWPIRNSGEVTDPVGPTGRQFMTFDPADPDTQYTGFEHVWRTRNNGGDRAYLEANCRIDGGNYGPGCGDWEPLGEFLTREVFGQDRAGGVIVAAERSSADSGTLWAATSLGRVFVTRNADAPADAVSFLRLDSSATPPRFISGIAVDDRDPNRAFIAYSGFNALTPDTPGHVFEVRFDGEVARFVPIDHNLGDLPVNHLVRDDVTGDLYAATDFGVLTLPAGTATWQVAGAGLPVVLTPHLEIHPKQRLLFAATHGMGAWYLELGPTEAPACLEAEATSRKKAVGPRCLTPPPAGLQALKRPQGPVP